MALPGGQNDKFYIGFLILLVGDILQGVSMSELWSCKTEGITDITVGFGPRTYDKGTDAFEACHYMVWFAFFFDLIAVFSPFLIILLVLLNQKKIKQLPVVSLGASIAGCVFTLIAVLLWAIKVHKDPYDLCWGFFVNAVSGVMMPAGGFLVKKNAS